MPPFMIGDLQLEKLQALYKELPTALNAPLNRDSIDLSIFSVKLKDIIRS